MQRIVVRFKASCTVSEIQRDIGRKQPVLVLHSHLNLALKLGVTPLDFQDLRGEKTSVPTLRRYQGTTDGQTNARNC